MLNLPVLSIATIIHRLRRPLSVGGICATLVLAYGCGHSAPADQQQRRQRETVSARGSGSPPVTVCPATARTAMAGFMNLPADAITAAASTGNNAMPQCSLRAHRSRPAGVKLTANVDTAPQPYFVLERAVVEASQQFTTRRMIAPPEAVTGLGIGAAWFPAERQLMTTDGKKLITISVSWGGVSQGRRRSLAETVARAYLIAPKNGAGPG